MKRSRYQDIKRSRYKSNKLGKLYARNPWGKPKNRTLKTLTWKKSRIIETFGNLILLFSQKGVKRWKDYPYWSRKTYFWISNDKKICAIFNNFFSNVVSDLKIPSCCDYFPQKNTISLKYHWNVWKTPQYSQYWKKETWFSIFIQKDYSRGDNESCPGIKH